MKQERLIDKSKKEDLNSEPNKDILIDLERLQLYAKNYLKSTKGEINNIDNDNLNQSNTEETQSLSQVEVESLMPNVIRILLKNCLNYLSNNVWVFS